MASSSSSLGVEKPSSVGFGSKSRSRKKMVIVIALRILSIMATMCACLMMSLNKETKTFVVATIGNTPIKATLTAKFHETPANIFFVIANGLATVDNIVMLGLELCGKNNNGGRLTLISILDIMNLAIVSSGASSAAFMGDLARNGNSHAQWNKICDKFEKYCDHGSIAILVSFIGLGFLLALTFISNIRLRKSQNTANASV